MLVIAIHASLCDMDTCEDFVLWARARQPWLKRFLTLKNGTPSSAIFCRLFWALDPKQFEAFFRRWVSQTDLGIVFGKERINQTSNQITAIPELLEALYIQDFLVRIDA